MLHAGADRVRDRVIRATERRQMTRLQPVRSLLSDWLPAVAEDLKTWIETASKKRGPKPIALAKLAGPDPYVMSLIALRTVLDSVTTERVGITGLAIEIGRVCEHELQVRLWEQADPELFQKVQDHLRRTDATSGHRRRVNINRFNHLMATGQLQVEWEKWNQEMQLRVGIALLDCIVRATGWFELKPDPAHVYKAGVKKGPKLVLVVKPELTQWLGRALDDLELRSPVYKPTLIPPKPWINTREGGYWTPYVRTPRLIRFKAQQEMQRDRAADEYEAIDMPVVYEAINYLQDVPWRINRRVLGVMMDAWSRNLGIGGLPLTTPFERPTVPADADTNEDALKAWKRETADTIRRDMKRLAEVMRLERLLGVAFEFKDAEEFYFPHMMDFRGRMYPIPVGLQPQGDDFARSLLEFADGKPVTTGEEDSNEGPCWLALHLSACWGFDKASYEDRMAWVEQREALWRRIAADPLGNPEWAVTSGPDAVDKPWCTLAAIFEWVGYLDHGQGYVSCLPVSVDGTCNGIQHLSAMTRDEVAGRYVNLVPSDKPMDIYKFVAGRLQEDLEQVEANAGLGAEHATYWLDLCHRNLPRDLTKRQVMVVPYGGTKDSFFEYTRAWLDKADPAPRFPDPTSEQAKLAREQRNQRVAFMVRMMWDEVRRVVSGGVGVMEWLQKTAKATVGGNQPIFWTTPSGFVVRHFYARQIERCVESILNGERVQLSARTPTDDLDPSSQLRGIAPNFVHSLDAAALTLCLAHAKERGIDGFVAVHDSYGTHAADMWKLFHVLREAFLLTHSENVLGEFRRACVEVVQGELRGKNPELSFEAACEQASLRLPPMPRTGDLQLGDVLSSDYFFA